MSAVKTIMSNKRASLLLRSFAGALVLMVLTVFSFASKGGGEKKKSAEFDSPFTPINSASSFTLRKAPSLYNTPMSGYHATAETRISLSPLISTYQKGNTTVILPFQMQSPMNPMTGGSAKSSLQLFGVKIQIPR